MLVPLLHGWNNAYVTQNFELTPTFQLTQSMGNLNVQGKETWLEPLAPLIHTYVGCVREFIDDLVTVFDSDSKYFVLFQVYVMSIM